MTTPDDTTGKRPKPIELVARAIYERRAEAEGTSSTWDDVCLRVPLDGYYFAKAAHALTMSQAEAVFDVLTKHGCISIEGIIARDEEMGK